MSQINADKIGNVAGTVVVPVTSILAGLATGYLEDTGISNVIQVAPTPPWVSYSPGGSLFIKVIASNTGPMTISVSGLSATAVKLPSGANPSAGDVSAGGIYHFIFDGTNFQLLTR